MQALLCNANSKNWIGKQRGIKAWKSRDERIESEQHDLVVLDLMLLSEDGLAVCRIVLCLI
jgi:DNA-binding response OmpR family regulator